MLFFLIYFIVRKSGVDFGLQVELFVDKSDVNFGFDRNNGKHFKACIINKASLLKY